eukprot:scaffold73248_cov32-Prasinocladus_malaysianus.AAC.1
MTAGNVGMRRPVVRPIMPPPPNMAHCFPSRRRWPCILDHYACHDCAAADAAAAGGGAAVVAIMDATTYSA